MKVFVYGSLKAGRHNHVLLLSATLLGEHVTTPEYTLYNLGAFPGVVCSGDTAIQGEVYNVDEYTFQLLDQLEGYPMFYNRKEIDTPYGKSWLYYLEGGYGKHIVKGGVW